MTNNNTQENKYQFLQDIKDWANERGLLDIEYQHEKQVSFIAEELSEYLRASTDEERCDGAADIIVFSANALSLLLKDNSIPAIIDCIHREFEIRTSQLSLSNIPTNIAFTLTQILELNNDKECIIKGYLCFIILALNAIDLLGFDFDIAMEETLKEINSRKGEFNTETGKWEKFKDEYHKSLWYKADYSLAKYFY